MKINKRQLRQIIKESLIRLYEEQSLPKLDDYGEEIKRGGQGWGYDETAMNRQGYNADGSKGPWFSRSVAVATAVFLNDNGQWYVLANQRGDGTPDYQGRWNLPCGYLDYNESTEEAAVREIREETGIRLNPSDLHLLSQSSSPDENRQNVCFFYVGVINGSVQDYPFSTAEMEENEVSGIQWVPIENVDNFKWAFWHNRLLQKAIPMITQNGKGNNVASYISNAIRELKNGGDTESIINMLETALNYL